MSHEDKEKYVDEAWKDSVAEEKRKEPEAGSSEPPKSQESPSEEPLKSAAKKEEDSPPVEISFLEYITSLAFQAMIFLGEVPHPVTNATEKDLRQAKLLIDTLVLLRHKTASNLTKEESDTLNAALYELQMRFIELVRQEGNPS